MTSFKELRQKSLYKWPDSAKAGMVKAAMPYDTASQFLASALKGLAVGRGFAPDYNQVESDFLDPASTIHSFNLGYAIVFQTTHKLPPPPPSCKTEYKNLAEVRLDFVRHITFGRGSVFSTAVYAHTEMILPPEYLPCFASRVMDIIRAVEGRVKKCLIAGLDNTIRNGVDEDTAAKKSGGYCRGFQQKHRS